MKTLATPSARSEHEIPDSDLAQPSRAVLTEPVWLLLLIGWLFAATSLDWHSRDQTERSAEPAPPLDLQASSGRDLRQLPGIGPARAADIVDLRWQRGGHEFDLQEVSGIGPKTEARVRDLLQQQPIFRARMPLSPSLP